MPDTCQHPHTDAHMKAALKTLQGEFTVQEVDAPPTPGKGWVKARVRVAGICGTDLRHWKVEDPHLECHIMGHELAGEVVEVGEEVQNVGVGDRVVIETVMGDGKCDWCRVQQYNICPELYPTRTQSVSKAYAEYVVGPADKFYKLPDHISFEEAALLDTFSVCLHGINLSNLRVNDKVAVIGAGTIGLGQVQLAKACGADVIVTDIVDSGLQMARDLGADVVVNSKTEDARARVMEFTGGRGVDIVYECAGGTAMPITLPQAVSFARRGGKIVIIGGFDKGPVSIPLEWQHIQMAEIQLIPSASYAFRDIYPEMRICLDLLSKGKLNASKMITHRFPIDDINQAFETARDKDHTNAVFVAIHI